MFYTGVNIYVQRRKLSSMLHVIKPNSLTGKKWTRKFSLGTKTSSFDKIQPNIPHTSNTDWEFRGIFPKLVGFEILRNSGFGNSGEFPKLVGVITYPLGSEMYFLIINNRECLILYTEIKSFFMLPTNQQQLGVCLNGV